MMKKIAILALSLHVASCAKAGPTGQSLASLARDLKDPESGKVVNFKGQCADLWEPLKTAAFSQSQAQAA
jgi:hypothetical protein